MPMFREMLEVPAEVATGAALEISQYTGQPNSGFVQLNDGVDGTYHIEASALAGIAAVWTQIGTDVTANMADPRAIPSGYLFIRIRCSVYTSGTPLGAFVGAARGIA
jgi:hypothetical protein